MIQAYGSQDEKRQNLEDLFYQRQDQYMVEKLRRMKEAQETKENLAKVSGIENESVLEKLVELNVRPETLASLAIVPLVEVAWADREISEKEKAAVLKAAKVSRWAKEMEDYQMLDRWLEKRPSEELLAAWIVYMQGLSEKLTPAEKNDLKAELLGHAKQIAEASGGFLGFGKISEAEEKMLRKLEKGFE